MSNTTHKTNTAQQAEQHLERWLTSSELRQYMCEAPEITNRPLKTGPYIAISREVGAAGSAIGRHVAELLGWDVLDKGILDFMAERYHMPRDLLDFVDENEANWIHDAFTQLFAKDAVSHSDYIQHLQRILYLAAVHGNVVIIGRGAHCILPRKFGMAVRIIGPLEERIERTMLDRGMNHEEARKYVESHDAAREELCRYSLGSSNDDPKMFDLVINVARITPDMAAEHVAQMFRQMHPGVFTGK